MSLDAATDGIAGATAEILKTGLLGALLIVVSTFAFWVVRQWNKTSEARVTDNKDTTEKLLNLATKMGEAVQGFTAALGTLNATIAGLKITAEQAAADEKRAHGVMDVAVADIVRTTDAIKTTTDSIRISSEDVKRNVEDLRRKG